MAQRETDSTGTRRYSMSNRNAIGAFVTAALASLSTACASSSTGTPSPVSGRDRVVTAIGTSTGSSTGSRTGSLDYYTDEGYESIELPIKAVEVWPLLLQAYQDLELPLASMDTEARIVGNPQLVAPRRIAGHRMSRLFRCGDTMTGPVADASTITIDVETRLDDVEGDADVASIASTLVRANAMPRDGTGANRPCTSSGQLETEIHEAILKRMVLRGPGS